MTQTFAQPRAGVLRDRDTEKLYRGYDRIGIRLVETVISDDNHLRIIPADRPGRECRYLFETETAKVKGYRALVRGDWWNAQIIVPPPGTPLMLVWFNPARRLHGINYPPAEPSDLAGAMARLESELAGAGITTRLSAAAVRYLEVASDVTLDEPLESFLEALARFSPPSRLPAPRRYKSGLSWANGSVAVVAYDKRQEVEARGAPVESLPPAGTLRLETRFKNPASVRRRTGISRLGDLADSWPRCEASHLALLDSLLGRRHA